TLLPALALAQPASAAAQDAQPPQLTPQEAAFFEKEVLPILKANCFKCHGDGKARGGLSLTSRQGLLEGGERGPAVSLQKPDESLLLRAVNYQGGLEMPPTGKLPAQEIEILSRWVKAGAPWPAGKEVVVKAPRGKQVTAEDRNYWAYR